MKKISNEQELFDLFCNDDTCFGEYQEPFLEIVHNEVWAANRRMAVAVKAELVSGKYSKRETKDMLRVSRRRLGKWLPILAHR